MASSELLFLPPVFYAPDADAGSCSSGSAAPSHDPIGAAKQPEPERFERTQDNRDASDAPSPLDAAQLVPFLKTEFAFPAIDTYIEARFEHLGLLAILEQAGVLPQLEDPNPYDLEHESVEYEQWWTRHPSEQEAFYAQLEERQQLLRYLHIGAIVGYLAGRDLYPGRNFPK